MSVVDLAERGWLPDPVVRTGIRRRIARRWKEERGDDEAAQPARLDALIRRLDDSAIVAPRAQVRAAHDALPVELLRLVLGPRLKASCCLYSTGRENLAGAEEAMLATCADRAELADGQRVLDLGCGYGSFAMWAAGRYPRSTIVAWTDSDTERAYVQATAVERGLRNVVVCGARDALELDDALRGDGFDRIVSIELFGRLRNYRRLFAMLASWLKDDGRVFAQVAANRTIAYTIEACDDDDWIAREFLDGCTMPSFDLLKRFDHDLVVDKRWWVSGRHYERTAEDWLRRFDANEEAIRDGLDALHDEDASRAFGRWRMLLLAACELFAFDGGRSWGVGQFRFAKPGRVVSDA